MFAKRLNHDQLLVIVALGLFILLEFCGLQVSAQQTSGEDRQHRVHNTNGTVDSKLEKGADLPSYNNRSHTVYPTNEREPNQLYGLYTRDKQEKLEIISHSILRLSHQIATKLTANNLEEKTHVFSPFSIATALSLLFLGSNGATYREFVNFLGYNQSETNPKYDQSRLPYDMYPIHMVFGDLVNYILNQVGSNDNVSETEKNMVEVANGIFVAREFQLVPTYKRAAENVYGAEINDLDFIEDERTSRNYINDWAYAKTHGKIKSIFMDRIDSKTKMIIVNSLYFLGFWETTFFENVTRNDTFYPNGSRNPGVTVEFMVNGGQFPYHRSRKYGCEILGIPYKNDQFRMYIILPKNSSRQKLKELQRTLNADIINELISKVENVEIIISIPKLNVENTIDLKKILAEIGLRTIFTESECNLSLITFPPDYKPFGSLSANESINDRLIFQRRRRRDLKDGAVAVQRLNLYRNPSSNSSYLFADAFLHKISLTVNERGTEGGAVTFSTIRKSMVTQMVVNTPYIFLIRHEPSKIPIFYGTVFEPEQQAEN